MLRVRENVGAHYEVTIGLMRGTLALAKGKTTRRELRQSMMRAGWSEPYCSGYLDMVQRALRQVINSPRRSK